MNGFHLILVLLLTLPTLAREPDLKWEISTRTKYALGGFIRSPEFFRAKSTEFNSELDAEDFQHSFSITMIVAQRTLWTPTIADSYLESAMQIFKQCRIKLGRAVLVSAELEDHSVVEYHGFRSGRAVELATSIPDSLPRPVVFFIKEFDNKQSAKAYPTNWLKQFLDDEVFEESDMFPIRDTVWVPQKYETEAYRRLNSVAYRNGFNVLAHELVHIFGNQDHVSEHNLMAGWPDSKNADLSDEQCNAARSSFLIDKD